MTESGWGHNTYQRRCLREVSCVFFAMFTPMNLTQLIGARIRKERVVKGLSQDDVAGKLSVTTGAYAKIERGETDPSATRLFQLADILRVDVMVFLKDGYSVSDSNVNNLVPRAEFEDLVKRVDMISKKIGLKTTENKPQKSVTRRSTKR
jgi:transcriptional regulator with XRE-family HTH domain